MGVLLLRKYFYNTYGVNDDSEEMKAKISSKPFVGLYFSFRRLNNLASEAVHNNLQCA
jgi:hypothetical protein